MRGGRVHHTLSDGYPTESVGGTLIRELADNGRSEMSSTFGSYIASRRKQLGISQKELASMIQKEDDERPITPQYLNDIERDRRQPTSDHIISQFSDALQVEADYLFYLSGILPSDVRNANIPREDVVQMFSAFRRTSK